jgi:hypothetical protein
MTPTTEKQNISIDLSALSEGDMQKLIVGDTTVLSPIDQLAVKCAVFASELLHFQERFGGLYMTPKWRREARRDELLESIANVMTLHNDAAKEHNAMIPNDSNRRPIPLVKIDVARLAKMYA